MDQHPIDEDALVATLRAIAAEDAPLDVSPGRDANLRRAVKAIRTRRRRRYAAAFVLGSALLIAVMVPGRAPVTTPTPRRVVASEVRTGYLPLTYGDLPMEESRVVRLAIPRTTLVTFGLAPVDVAESSEMVLADVVVGEDGLARAVRFVERRR